MAKRGFFFKPKPKGSLNASPRSELAPEERESRREAGRRQGEARRGRKGKKRLSARQARLDREKQAVQRETLEERKARIRKNYKPRMVNNPIELAKDIEKGSVVALPLIEDNRDLTAKVVGTLKYRKRCRRWRERTQREA